MDSERVKDLMYDTGMTRLEAEAYIVCVEEGSTATAYARSIGCNRSLISQRVLNAKHKKLESEQ